MKRFTTNKDVSEMGMYELAHNACYAKDGLARYRDFEKDVDARILTRELLKKYADGDDAFVDDDDFDEEMIELLQYGTDTIEGLIALFYRNLWAMSDLRGKLKEYEDAEDNGLLKILPVAIRQTVYTNFTMRGWYLRDKDRPYQAKVVFIGLNDSEEMGGGFFNVAYEKQGCMMQFRFSDIGKSVFLTKEEAEQALADMLKEV